MALIIAITYSLTDDNSDGDNIGNITQNLIVDANGNVGVNNTTRVLNGSEIFTILLETNWPLTGNILKPIAR